MEQGRVRVEVDDQHFYTYSYKDIVDRATKLISAFQNALEMFAMEPGKDMIFSFIDLYPEEE